MDNSVEARLLKEVGERSGAVVRRVLEYIFLVHVQPWMLSSDPVELLCELGNRQILTFLLVPPDIEIEIDDYSVDAEFRWRLEDSIRRGGPANIIDRPPSRCKLPAPPLVWTVLAPHVPGHPAQPQKTHSCTGPCGQFSSVTIFLGLP